MREVYLRSIYLNIELVASKDVRLTFFCRIRNMPAAGKEPLFGSNWIKPRSFFLSIQILLLYLVLNNKMHLGEQQGIGRVVLLIQNSTEDQSLDVVFL